MKAIEILFDEIDKLNTQIKESKTISDKVYKVYLISQVTDVVRKIAEYSNHPSIDDLYI